MSKSQKVKGMVPSLNWPLVIKDLGIEKELDTLIVMQPKYMEVVQEIFKSADIKTWKIVMRWATLNDAACSITFSFDS